MTEKTRVYVVDDDGDLREALLEVLASEGIPADGFATGRDMLRQLDPEWEGVILSDIRMPGLSGLEVMQEARQLAPDVPFILITAHGDIQMAVKAVRDGAFDFIEKPAPPEHLLAVVARALTTRKLQLENARLRRRVARGANLGARFLGRSAVIRTCRREIISVAPLDVDVLLHGETGTGKELAARCIHDLSGAEGDFVSLNCGSLSEATFDDVMFAESETRPGAIPRARGGTLFLDNVTSLSETVQLRLLDVMDRRSGESPFRVIGANPRSLSDAHGAGELRDDLYYRLNLAEIELPPLRDRENDVFLLLDLFINESVARHERRYPTMTADDLRPFKAYHWPGNLRELRNVAEKLVIGLKVRFQKPSEQVPDGLDYDSAMQDFEASLLRAALLKAGGRKGEAAELLKIPRKRLYLRLKATGLLQDGS
ncbi:sigma-54-dependent transcriptional regulator [Stappia sp.]|uniref:sigma-54-dependent transcriptional regulator n=1 Tax=Stappia sp. TaxID=1870903 RepID=UPI003C7E81FD